MPLRAPAIVKAATRSRRTGRPSEAARTGSSRTALRAAPNDESWIRRSRNKTTPRMIATYQ
jgi:hypothetical protein